MTACTRAFALAALGLGLFAAPAATHAKDTFVYVHDSGDGNNRIYGFALGSAGELTPLDGSPFATGLTETGCGGFCQTLSYSKKRRALVASGGDGMQALLIQDDGTLDPADPFLPNGLTGAFLGNETVDLGKRTFVYANDTDGELVHTFSLDENGALAAVLGGQYPTGGGSPDGMAVAKRKVLLSINESGDSIASYKIGKDGTLTVAPTSPLPLVTGLSWNLHLGPTSRIVYTGEEAAPHLFGFAIDFKTADLTPLDGSPFPIDSENGVSFAPGRSSPGITMPGELPADVSAQAVKPDKHGVLTALGSPQPLTGQAGMQAHGRTRNGKIFLVADNVMLRSYTVAKDGTLTLLDGAGAAGDVNDVVVVER